MGCFFERQKKLMELLMLFKKFQINQNKLWVDKGSKFHNRSMKSWLVKNAIEMYSTHKETKCVVAEKVI